MSSIESRCTGHCCRRFAMEHSFEELQRQAALVREGSSEAIRQITIPDVAKIAAMVIPLAQSRDGTEFVYSCRHLSAKGDCTIYEARPQMCRDFPEENGCHYRGCTSSRSAYAGKGIFERAAIRWQWLRNL